MEPYRPVVSRETRLLLAIVLVSLSMLWVLARIRFPGRPATPNPVPPVLAQLAPPSALEDIAATVGRLQPRLEALLTPIEIRQEVGAGSAPSPSTFLPALRVRDDLVAAMIGERAAAARSISGSPIEIAAHDPVSGMALLRLPGEPAELDTWSSQGEPYPRYLVASDASAHGISLRPAFIGAFDAIDSPLWPARIWAVPAAVQLRPGTFVFTVSGELAGLVSERHGRMSLVPGTLVMTVVDRLANQPRREPGSLGVEVQTLTPDLAAAVHATAGALVTWVDPSGPAAGLLSPMDVIEGINGKPVTTDEQWDAQALALSAGDEVVLSVRQDDDVRELKVTAQRREVRSAVVTLGLTMRTIPRVGAEVLQVETEGAAVRAGIQRGDIITTAGPISLPSSAQVSRVFAATTDGGTLVVALTRGHDHRIVAIRKRP